MEERNNKFAYFNLLKFIGAITIAILLHYRDHFTRLLGLGNPFPSNLFLEYVSRASYFFVEMFFMISGLLFMIAYYDKIINGKKFKDFIKNRIIRIYPLLIITTIFMYIINIILYKHNGQFWEGGTLSLWYLFSDLVFAGKPIFNIGNTLNGPIWYLNVLLICYILAFILTKLSLKYKTKYVFIIPIIIGLVIRYSRTSFPFWNINIARGLMSFFMGVVVAIFIKRYDQYSEKSKRTLKKILLLELIIFFYLLTRRNGDMYVDDTILSYTFLVFPELIIFLYDMKILNKICSTEFMKFLGNISFGIYLWNFPIYSTFYYLIINRIIQINILSSSFLIFNAIVHIFIATISYFLIDKLLVNYIKKKIK